MKCKCGTNTLHPIRVKYGYKTCVSCSNTERYGCMANTNHKTGNEIQIMSQSQAAAIAKSSRRKGYGTCLR